MKKLNFKKPNKGFNLIALLSRFVLCAREGRAQTAPI